METIVSVTECMFKIDGDKWPRYYDGYIVLTNKQTIKIGISDGQSCCEDYGHVTSEDDFEKFAGAKYLGIELTDTNLCERKFQDMYEGGVMFVDILTDRGKLQFVTYNYHNGYYGHESVVISKELNHEEVL
jgi:hypothetical protein